MNHPEGRLVGFTRNVTCGAFSPVPFMLKLFVLVMTGLTASGVGADSDVPAGIYAEAADCMLESRYDAAEEVIEHYIESNPSEPAGYFLKAAVIHYRSIDYEDWSRDGDFDNQVESACDAASRRLEEKGDDLWAAFFLHASRSMLASRETSRGRLLSGLRTGYPAIRGLRAILDADSSFHDAGLIVGSYRFWRSEALGGFSWLPMISDEREDGISQVRAAVEHGCMTGPLANVVLLEMLLVHDLPEARELAKRLHAQHPACRIFAWQLGEAYKRNGMVGEATCVFEQLAEWYAGDESDDGSGQLRCWWKLADMAKTLGKTDMMRYYSRKVLEAGEQYGIRERHSERIRRAEEMCEEPERD